MKTVSLTKQAAVPHQIHTYAELRQQIHHDLRIQHPDWIQPNGESPICDSYEVRLTKLLDTFTRTGSKGSVADIHRALEKEFESKHDGDCSRGGQGPDGARSHD
jgi:hypothetical protein